MHAFRTNPSGTGNGILFVALFALAATLISGFPQVARLGFSPLVVGIILGGIYANSLRHALPKEWEGGILFSARNLLRLAVIFYGFRITFQQIGQIGLEGILVSLLMLSSTLLLGTWVGMKLFKLDRDTSMLTAAGSAICGAAAVLAFEPVLKSEPHKSAIAVATVVLFGTISMFLYPILYSSGLLHLNESGFGIFVGGTLHEVAQVVAAGSEVGPLAASDATIVKMTRVMMIAPVLLALGYYLSRRGNAGAGSKVTIPWFAVGFIAASGLNSLSILPSSAVGIINTADTFVLTMAMSALGMETRVSKFRGVGLRPIYTALVMFLWLLFGGYFITKGVLSLGI